MMVAGNALVVDNEDDQRRLLKRVLERSGFHVAVADSGEGALSRFRKAPVDVVFTDLIMTGMDGVELCERLLEIAPRLAVIAVSGHIGLFEDERLARAGFAGFISKPYHIADIEAQTRRVLSNENRQRNDSRADATPA